MEDFKSPDKTQGVDPTPDYWASAIDRVQEEGGEYPFDADAAVISENIIAGSFGAYIFNLKEHLREEDLKTLNEILSRVRLPVEDIGIDGQTHIDLEAGDGVNIPVPNSFDVLLVDQNELTIEAADFIKAAISYGYLIGRFDQIHDSRGCECPVAVRPENLDDLIETAQLANFTDDELNKVAILEEFENHRNRLR